MPERASTLHSVATSVTVALVATVVTILGRGPLAFLNGSVQRRDDELMYAALCTPTLFVCTHDYEHIDLFAMEAEIRRWRRVAGRSTVVVVAKRGHNRIFDKVLLRDGRCLFVEGDTVRRVLRALRRYNVCLFLYRDASGTGAYHMVRQHPNVVLVRITSRGPACRVSTDGVLQCVVSTMNRSYRLTYSRLDRPAPSESCTDFMRRLKTTLYPHTDGGARTDGCH